MLLCSRLYVHKLYTNTYSTGRLESACSYINHVLVHANMCLYVTTNTTTQGAVSQHGDQHNVQLLYLHRQSGTQWLWGCRETKGENFIRNTMSQCFSKLTSLLILCVGCVLSPNSMYTHMHIRTHTHPGETALSEEVCLWAEGELWWTAAGVQSTWDGSHSESGTIRERTLWQDQTDQSAYVYYSSSPLSIIQSPQISHTQHPVLFVLFTAIYKLKVLTHIDLLYCVYTISLSR